MQPYTLGMLGSPPVTDDEDGHTATFAINNAGVVAGYTSSEAAIWDGKQLKKLPMPGNGSFATDINN